MTSPYTLRVTASSYHVCAEDRKKFAEWLMSKDIGDLPIGGVRSVANVDQIPMESNVIRQIVQADAFRESLILQPPRDESLVQIVVGWNQGLDANVDLILNASFPLILTRKLHGGLVTMPMWGLAVS